MLPERLWFHRATPPGGGAVALFEVYGPGAEGWIARHVAFRAPGLPPGGSSRLGRLRAGAAPDAEVLDEVIVTRLGPGAMWSRMEAWTIGLHGGPATSARVAACLEGGGARERDLRGVLLSAVEAGALCGVEACAWELLPEAITPLAASFLLRQAEGELARALRAGAAMAQGGDRSGALELARRLLDGAPVARRLVEPLRVLLAGRPNAGKSTLFNRWVAAERAAVSRAAGTTRDIIEEHVSLGGYPLLLADSAGFRSGGEAGALEAEGARRALAWGADVVLYLLGPPWRPSPLDDACLRAFPGARTILIASQLDRRLPGDAGARPGLPEAVGVSGLTGEGLGALGAAVAAALPGDAATRASPPCALFTRAQERVLRGVAKGWTGGTDGTARPGASASPGPGARDGLDAIERAFLECLAASWP